MNILAENICKVMKLIIANSETTNENVIWSIERLIKPYTDFCDDM